MDLIICSLYLKFKNNIVIGGKNLWYKNQSAISNSNGNLKFLDLVDVYYKIRDDLNRWSDSTYTSIIITVKIN